MLHEVSFEVGSGERVGIGKQVQFPLASSALTHIDITSIVGRTGSGKVRQSGGVMSKMLTGRQSSLTLALLRCILTDGNVRYDGLPTEKLNLDALRSNVTIIPQVVS